MDAAGAPLPAIAAASAPASVGHDDWDSSPARRALYNSPGPALPPPDVDRGWTRDCWMRASRAVVGSPAGRHGQPASAAHQAKNEVRADSRLVAWAVAYWVVLKAGSMAPSSTMART